MTRWWYQPVHFKADEPSAGKKARQKSLQMAAIRGWSTRNWRSRCFGFAFQNSSSHQQESNSDSHIIVIIQRFASLKNVFVTNPSFSFRLQFYTRTAATLPYELKLIEILNSLPDDSFSRTQSLQYISSVSLPYEYLWWTLFATASSCSYICIRLSFLKGNDASSCTNIYELDHSIKQLFFFKYHYHPKTKQDIYTWKWWLPNSVLKKFPYTPKD